MTKHGSKRDIEAEVTRRVIEALEAGTVPWHKPWTAAGILPTSTSTGKAYRGINVWLLSLSANAAGYGSPYWLTYRQAQGFGAQVRGGEKGTLVVFWKGLQVKDRDDPSGERTKRIPLLRHYTVFNAEQCDGLGLPPRFDLAEREPVAVEDAVAELIAGYKDGPAVRYVRGDRAYYEVRADVVTLPELEQYRDSAAFTETALHELTHSTGHASRLDRFARGGERQHFGSQRYAREELVAEMGAAMLAVGAGVEISFENTAAYVGSWLGALRDDKGLVIKAAQQAQRAVDRIVGVTYEERALAA
jgi:antirestriction protein ArdC